MSGFLRPPAVIGAVALAAVTVGGWTLWRARAVLDRSASQVSDASQLPFETRPLSAAAPSGIERLPAAASFHDAAYFQGALWIASSGALFEYTPASGLIARFEAGVQLPPAPLTRLAVAPIEGRPQLIAGTQGEGWLLYDGHSLRHVRPLKPEHRKVTALLPLSTGEILIGTEKAGVLAWSGAALRDFQPNLAVTALAGTFDDLWIGTLGQGAIHRRGGLIEEIRAPLPDPHVFSLAVGPDRAAIGTSSGIAEFRGGRFHGTIADGAFAKALHYEGKRLVIGTLDDDVEAIVEAQGQTVTVKRGEIRIAGKREIAAGPGLLTDGNIAALAVEPGGRLWVGYFDRGLDLIDGTTSTHIEDEHLFCINRIVPTRDGAIVATANGLVFADRAGKPRQVLGRRDGLLADHVTDVLVERGQIAAATPAGVTFLGPSGPESLYAFHGLVNNHVYSLASYNGQWIAGTLGGASFIDGRVVRASYTTANSPLRHNWISALTTAGDRLYAGTYGAGVYVFDGIRWEPSSPSFEVNPNAMVSTEAAVYAGTLGQGLAIFDRSSGRWTFDTAGLPSLNVTALAAQAGQLWIGTGNGLVRRKVQ